MMTKAEHEDDHVKNQLVFQQAFFYNKKHAKVKAEEAALVWAHMRSPRGRLQLHPTAPTFCGEIPRAFIREEER